MTGFPGGKMGWGLAMAAVLTLYGWLDWDRETLDPGPDAIGVNSSPIPVFTYTDQNGKPFGTKELKGTVWMANLIYTRCPDTAPPMTANMARLRDRLKETGLNVKLVSFSVDPLHDTPDVLKRYAHNLRTDSGNWHFLTDDSEPEFHRFLKTAFGTPVQPQDIPGEGPPVIGHSTRFYLVNGHGKVMSSYDGLRPDYDQILRDVHSLQ
ncbi:protein SCO1/2 [Melghirimyces profundicolus]|uniref:Protein SCO1/2 n=1 Tax=Melghirimyces profundicolus TaxID=1242148 RepID=A0A2T6BW34_9BACL|nr:SCO family protein [Melghirimyces profundicolus]PTX60292.1 protein SCO1/2 [Melghirimyces profundicolus]